jgi:hypothetical protein
MGWMTRVHFLTWVLKGSLLFTTASRVALGLALLPV